MAEQRPFFSVVIACVNGLPAVGECLRALCAQRRGHDAEILVVNACRDGTAEHIRAQFPGVRLLDVPGRPGIPALRARGLAEARGDVLCILEDHCLVRDGWFDAIRESLPPGRCAVGGPVENGSPARLIDRAVFLCEYGAFMPPTAGGEVDGVAGNNVAYRREAVEAVGAETLAGYWEYFIHEEMRRAGVRFREVPAMVVDHKKEFGFLYFMRQRYHYSRSFAGMRRRRLGPAARWAHALAAPLLAPLMLYRTARHVFTKQRQRGTFLAALPLLSAFMISYAAGEGVGYLLGPGDSLRRVE